MTAVPAEASAPEPSAGARPPIGHAVSLRFVLAAEDADHLAERLDRLSGVGAASETLRVVYLDTPDHAIAALGLGFGIRRRGESGPASGQRAAVVGRSGWKRFIEPLSAATPRTARRELGRCLRHATAIEVAAQVETQRRLWSFPCGDSHAGVSLDRSTAAMSGKEVVLASARFACDAPNAEFFRFVTEACEADSLRLSAESDLARAYRSCDGPNAPNVMAFAPELDADMDAGAAFRVIAAACFDQFLLNETAIRATGDREAVHQCRIALRRLSACLRFFSGFIGGSDYETVRADLKELGAHLRNARDLDVMIAAVIAPALAVDPPSGAPALMREIEARREKAYADLVARLRAPASAAFFLRFAIWLEAGDWTRSIDLKTVTRRGEPIVRYARRKFERLNSQFAECCAELAKVSQEERHRTRIRAKNIRYDAEFFDSLARGKIADKRLRAFIEAVKDLQTVLGDWNDILMARQFLASFGEEAEADAKTGTETGIQTETATVAKPKRRSTMVAAANALAQRIGEISEAEFADKSAKACRSLAKVKPFWAKFG